MKPSTVCLPAAELRQLLSGDLSQHESTAAEEHLADCDVCRSSIERMIADSRWWDDARSSLAADAEHSNNFRELAPDAEHETTAQLLALLGPTDDPAMLGRIGTYEIVGLLGRGGMGAVFKGYDAALSRFVAIKMLLPHLAASGAARKRFAREARAAAAVVDDHVMAIHGVSEWNSVPYFVMPYSRGVSLQKRLDKDGPLEVKEILRIGMQAATGLAAAHAQGLVHRDVKPANIFLDEGVERVQLMDFGLARAVDDASLTRSGTLAGTPLYMSPEQARGESVDHRSDLFSLGSALYAMCTGHAPFRADSSYGVLRRIIDDAPRPIREINSDVPEWLEAFVMKLLSKSADERFESAEQVAGLLEDCVAHVQQPITTPLPSQLAVAAKSEKLSAPWIGVFATLALALTLFAGVTIVQELNKGKITIKSAVDDVPIRISQGDKVVEELTVSRSGTSVRIAAGKYVVEVDGEFTNLSVNDGVVSLKRGETEVVTVVQALVGQPNGAADSIRAPAAAVSDPGKVTVHFEQPKNAELIFESGFRLVQPQSTDLRHGRKYKFEVHKHTPDASVQLNCSIDIAESNDETRDYFAHHVLPLQITDDDIEHCLAQNPITKAIYISSENVSLTTGYGILETVVSSRLDADVDVVALAKRRGHLVAILRLSPEQGPSAEAIANSESGRFVCVVEAGPSENDAVPNGKSVRVLAAIEKDMIRLAHVGNPASVRMDGVPTKAFSGKVTGVKYFANPPLLNGQPGSPFEATISLDAEAESLKPGMTGEVDIVGKPGDQTASSKELEGTWESISITSTDSHFPHGLMGQKERPLMILLGDRQIRLYKDGRQSISRFEYAPNSKPPQFEKIRNRNGKTYRSHHLIDLDGDTLRLGYSLNGSHQIPVSFESPRVLIQTFRRIDSGKPSRDGEPSHKDKNGANADMSAHTSHLLVDVVGQFNSLQKDDPVGRNQPLLTDDEVITAVRSMFYDLGDLDISENDYQILREAIERGQFPDEWKIESNNSFQLRDGRSGQRWVVQLARRDDASSPFTHIFRSRYVSLEATTPVPKVPLPAGHTSLADWVAKVNEPESAIYLPLPDSPVTEDEVVAAVTDVIDKDQSEEFAPQRKALQEILNTRSLPELGKLILFRPQRHRGHTSRWWNREGFESLDWTLRLEYPYAKGDKEVRTV